MTPRPPDPRSFEGKLRQLALSFPETTEEFPWGERAIKVRGKAFIFLRADGHEVSFSLKLPTSGADALEMPNAAPTGYGLGRHGWVTFSVNTSKATAFEEFSALLKESYAAIAPKKLGKIVLPPG